MPSSNSWHRLLCRPRQKQITNYSAGQQEAAPHHRGRCMKCALIYRVKAEWRLQRQKKNCWVQSLRRQRLPAPILIGHWPCHKLLAKCLCVLEKGCVHMCMLELQACVCVCVLDRWAGDSDRLVCSQHFLVSGSESSSSYSYGCLRHACTHPIAHSCVHARTQPFTHACTHIPDAHSQMGTVWVCTLTHMHARTHKDSSRDWRGLIGMN